MLPMWGQTRIYTPWQEILIGGGLTISILVLLLSIVNNNIELVRNNTKEKITRRVISAIHAHFLKPYWVPYSACSVFYLNSRLSTRNLMLPPPDHQEMGTKSLEWVAAVIAFDCEELWWIQRPFRLVLAELRWCLQSWYLWFRSWSRGAHLVHFALFMQIGEKRWQRLAQIDGAASWASKPYYSVDRYPFRGWTSGKQVTSHLKAIGISSANFQGKDRCFCYYLPACCAK